jgi:nitronate monooxygenase/enoyl-[acyl-carrier protein] reductase II
MLRTPLLALLGIEHPIIQAGMGTFGSGAALAAAVSNAGAIGSIGAAKRTPEDLRTELADVQRRTSRPYIVNFTSAWLRLHPECLDTALAAKPRAISVSLGLPGTIVPRIHAASALVIVQVQTVEQACRAADEGADIIIAQGAEAGGVGGFGGRLSGMVLVPAIVDALAPLPVVASGGITDGRCLAAHLVLGAAGASIGTRFLASAEATVGDDWKQRLVDAPTGETIRFETEPRADLASYVEAPSSGQGVGLIRSVEPAATIVADLVRGAEEALARTEALVVEAAAA